MTTLLLTGAGGFLGSHILQQALQRTNDLNIVAVDSFRHNGGTDRITAAMSAVDFPSQIGKSRMRALDDTMKRVTVVTHDLAAPFSAQQIDSIGPVDYIVHAAARCSVDDSIQDPYGHVMNNIQSTLGILDLATKQRPQWYLHVSTDEVFGPSEADAGRHNPSSPYSASKAACEDLTLAWARTYGVPAEILTSANLFGERQSQLAFIPRVIRLLLEGKPVPIHTNKVGQIAWRNYTYAPNVGAWVVDRLTEPQKARHTMLRGQLGTNVQSLATRIADIMDSPIDLKIVEGEQTRPGFDFHYKRLPGDPSWKPDVDADQGLQNTVRWFLDHREWLMPNG